MSQPLQHPLFDSLPPEARDALRARLLERHFPRGALVLNQGDAAAGLWFIESGQLQFQIGTASGDSCFIGIAKPGDYLGDCELLTASPHFANITALSDCQLWLLPAEHFWRAMQSHTSFATEIARRIAHSLKLMQQVQAARQHMSLEQQLAGIIAYVAEHYGHPMAGGGKRIDLTQAQLADMAGASRQSIHKPLQRWKQAGWIDYRYGRLQVNDLPAILAQSRD